MLKIKKLSIVLSLLTVIALTSMSMSTSVNAYVSYKTLNIPVHKQEMSNTCWAAVVQMIIHYFDASYPTQSQIITYIFGSPVNQGATNSQQQQALSHWNIHSNTASTLSFSTVVSQINNNYPIKAGIVWKSSGTGHALLIRGFYQNTDSSMEQIYYMDPSPNADTYQYMTYSAFNDNSQFYWNNSLYYIYVS